MSFKPGGVVPDKRKITLPRELWHRLLYSASLGTPMYGPPYTTVEIADETQEAYRCVAERLEARNES